MIKIEIWKNAAVPKILGFCVCNPTGHFKRFGVIQTST